MSVDRPSNRSQIVLVIIIVVVVVVIITIVVVVVNIKFISGISVNIIVYKIYITQRKQRNSIKHKRKNHRWCTWATKRRLA